MATSNLLERAQVLLRQMLGPQAQFRDGQWQAIDNIVTLRGRVLVVQRTGWGKSLVYFLSTKLLRQQGSGPTILVSPLLSLMRNQIEAASRIGIRAFTINSSNRTEWDAAEAALAEDACDILLISPERLANDRFMRSVLPGLSGRAGLFVVDEVHCISDWGHDFRPDYRRIIRLMGSLPAGMPVLGTTATANDRVVADVQQQLGPNLVVLRGPLARASLRLQNIVLSSQAERLAWLAENITKFKGSGVIYCLTVADVQRVTNWLKSQGISAEAYHAGDDATMDREALEKALLDNDLKALVATVALGMGFDKPDLAFVIHFQRPGSVVAYYQQVGRAGRAVDRAYGILLSGAEDDDIQDFFIDSAFPAPETMTSILDAVGKRDGISMNELLALVNVSRSMADRALKLLEIDGAIEIKLDKKVRYYRASNLWQPDTERTNRITGLRRAELAEMQAYVAHRGCLMEFLARALDDPNAQACGVCANCQGKGFRAEASAGLVRQAADFLGRVDIVLEPKKRWPQDLALSATPVIPAEARNAPGRSLCYYGDPGWGRLVREGKYERGRFDDQLVEASAIFIRERWIPAPFPEWLTAIPSRRHPRLVYDFASRLADSLGIPFVASLVRTLEAPEQKLMANSSMQARNVAGTLDTIDRVPAGAVLLIDDIVDSGWTLTLAGWLLREKGSGVVHPFTLARATARKI
ncbi:MAG TPA: RecQ family ATP-dependent DNA helicase [Blastocatellia bacterium]|nr:RecQ family ATP-dependent DNA helicase [Blastocatellia bacterium]